MHFAISQLSFILSTKDLLFNNERLLK
jgi:hypothetical protein